MRRSESHEQLTPQADQSYESMTAQTPPGVAFRGERQPAEQSAREDDSSFFDADRMLNHGASHIVSLFAPVSICMLFVVIICTTIPNFWGSSPRVQFWESAEGDATVDVGQQVLMAVFVICAIILATVIMVILFKFGCYKIITGWITFSFFLMLFGLTFLTFATICSSLPIFTDYITLSLIVWNIGITGIFSIFWKTPLIVQQAILILMSAQVALLILRILPQWTVWTLLALLAVWDLFAVLYKHGPLRILVNTASERRQSLPPGLLYSTRAMMADAPRPDNAPNFANRSDSASDSQGSPRVQRQTAVEAPVSERGPTTSMRARSAVSAFNEDQPPAPARSREARNIRDMEEEVMLRDEGGFKLGLGDFVFYSVLIGVAAKSRDWATILAVFVSVLMGMASTLLVLIIRGHPLPALPFSIFSGIIFYFCTHLLITPFCDALGEKQMFV